MRKTKNTMSTLLKIYIIFLIAVIYTFNYSSLAAKGGMEATAGSVEYSEEYKKYLNLTDEEKEKVLMPSQYDVTKEVVASGNPVYISNLMGSVLGADSSSSKYDLRDVISQNLVVRDQGELNNCWAFTATASAETSLAVADKKAGNSAKKYDFSEKHLDYVVSGNSTTDKYNIYGINKDIAAGGVASWAYASMAGGHSLVNESDMPYDAYTNKTTTSALFGKDIQTELYDTYIFPNSGTGSNRKEIKDFIVNYGGVFAPLHGDSMVELDSDYYNPSTGAIYCSSTTSYPKDHAVLIVGWDDNYSKNNFLSRQRPSNDGAWIIKNSWGSDYGDNGFMYVSYEDANITSENYGIKKIKPNIDYDYVYQYDELFPNQENELSLTANADMYLKNDFTKQSTNDEYITKIGITVPETQTLQVFVNPKGTNADSNLQLVTLEEGSSKTVEPGFHKLVFKDPVKITGNNFSVIVAATGKSHYIYYTEAKTTESFDPYYSKATIETNKTFVGFGYSPEKSPSWQDLGTYNSTESSILNCDSTIKVFTTKSGPQVPTITGISIKNNPTKTSYYEGDNFVSTGMVIKANYSDNTSRDLALSDLTITNATNLAYGQTSVKVSYNGFTIDVPITVLRNSITSLNITHAPNKTSYEVGENFNHAGLVITATYANGNVNNVNISSITFTNNTSLKEGQTYVTASFGGKSINIPITVKKTSQGNNTTEENVVHENNIPENNVPENVVPENNIPENNVPENKVPENNVPENNIPDNPTEEPEEPQNTDFTYANANVVKIQNRNYTSDDKKDHSMISIDVTNLKRPTTNDSMEYYVYISQKANEEDISKWVKITEQQKDSTKLSFTIDTKDFENVEDYDNASELYVYIKEVAKSGGNQSSKTSSGLKTQTKGNTVVDYYEDDVLKKSKTVDEIYEETNAQGKDVKDKDNTTASGKLPQTGAKVGATLVIGFIVLYGVHSFIEYKKINSKLK